MRSTSPAEAESPARRSGWRNGDILRILALITGFYIALELLWSGRTIVLLTFLGVLFGLMLSAGVDRLERWRVPRSAGAALVVLACGAVLGGLTAIAAPSIVGQLQALQTRLPEAVGQIEQWVQDRERGFNRMLQPEAPRGTASPPARPDHSAGNRPVVGSFKQGIADQIGGITQHFFAFFSSTLAVLGGLLLIIFVAIFVAVDARTYRRGLMHLFPHRMRSEVGEVLGATGMMLRRWLLAQFAGMVIIGTLTTVVLLILGVEAAVALGTVAGLLEFIPIAGPILSAVPAVAMGFLHGTQMAVYVVIAYSVIQQVEANLIYPLLMKKGLEIPPVLTLFAQGVMSLAFGFLGLLTAVPLLAATLVPIKMLYVRDVVGDEMKLPGGEPETPGADGR